MIRISDAATPPPAHTLGAYALAVVLLVLAVSAGAAWLIEG